MKKTATSIGWTDPRTTEGEIIDPARFPRKIVTRIKTMGQYRYAGLYQQRPSPAEGGIVKRAWFDERRYTGEPKVSEIIQSWDMAFKDVKTSDYVCGQVWGRQKSNFYLLDQVHARLDFVATCLALQKMCRDWPLARLVLVEDKANGTAIISALRGIVPGLVPVEPHGTKDARLSAVTPYMEAGNVWIPDERQCPGIGEWLDELCVFPFGKNDDQADATSQALLRFSEMSGGQGAPLGVGESPSWVL